MTDHAPSRVPPPRGRNPFSRRGSSRRRATDGRRGRVHDEHDRLPGGLHRSVVSRPDRRDDRADDRQLRHQRRRSRSPARRRSPASSFASCRARYSNWRADRRPRELARRRRKSRFSKASTRADSRGTCASVGVMRGVIGAGDDADRRGARRARGVPEHGRARPRHRASRRASAYEWGNPQAPYHIVAYDFGIKRNILRLFDEHGCRVTVVPADDAGRGSARAANRTACSSRTAPAIRPRSTYAPDTIRAIAERGGADVRHLPGAPAARAHVRRRRPRRCRTATAAGITR